MLDKVKVHISKHQDAYIVGGVAVITCIIVRGTVLRSGAGVGILHSGVTNAPSQFFTRNSTINIITVVESERGHPGWPIKCVETGQKWLKQGAAAFANDVSPSMMSTHITKNIPDNIHGLHFVRTSLTPI